MLTGVISTPRGRDDVRVACATIELLLTVTLAWFDPRHYTLAISVARRNSNRQQYSHEHSTCTFF